MRRTPKRTGIPPNPALEEQDRFLEGGIEPGGYYNVLYVAIPLIASTASLTVMLFVDRMFLSWHSAKSVAAAAPGGITYFTICSFFLGTAQYVNTIVAQKYGKGDKTACSRAVWQGFAFALLSAPVILALIFPGRAFISWAGHGEELVRLESDYFTYLMLGGIALPFNASVSSFFSGRGKTRIVMWGNILGNSANILADYVLIFGKFGFPELGIKGAGIASAVTNFIPCAFWLTIFLSTKYQEEYKTRASMVWDSKLFMVIIRYGIPSGAQFFLDVGSFTFFVMIVGRLGEVELAVNNIALAIEIPAFLPMVGMSIATSTLVGEYIGRNQYQLARKSAYSGLKLALGYSLVFTILFLCIPDFFLEIFLPVDQVHVHPEIISLGKPLLTIMAIYVMFDNTAIVMTGALNGAGDTKFTMWTQIGVSWGIFIPVVYILIHMMGMGLVTAWLCLLGYVLSIGVLFLLRFRSNRWSDIDMFGQLETS